MSKGPVEIDFSQVLENRYGRPMTEMVQKGDPDEEPEKEIVTLGYVAMNALYNFDPNKRIKGFQKATRHELSQRILKALKDEGNPVVSLKTDEAALIKKLIGDVMPTHVVGQAWEMIEREREPVSKSGVDEKTDRPKSRPKSRPKK